MLRNNYRIITALILSFGVHAAMLGMGRDWQANVLSSQGKPQRVAMTLVSRKIPQVEHKEVAVVPQQRPKQQIREVVSRVREIPAPEPVAVPIKKGESVKPVMPEERVEKRSVLREPVEPVIPVEEKAATEAGHAIADSQPPGSDVVVEETINRDIGSSHRSLPVSASLPLKEAQPLYKQNPPPAYPSIARRRRYQGTSLLEVLVNVRGRVDDIRVFKTSGHKVLDKAALKAVKGWLFEPGKRGEEKVEMWVRVPVRFVLQ